MDFLCFNLVTNLFMAVSGIYWHKSTEITLKYLEKPSKTPKSSGKDTCNHLIFGLGASHTDK